MMGKSKRCFGGHLPSRLFSAFVLINLPGCIFQASVVPRLKELEVVNTAFQTISILLQLVSTITMLITGLTDPGIVPKNYFDEKAIEQLDP